MPVDYKFAKGVDLPSFQYLAPSVPGNSQIGTSNVFDGTRFMYWAIQFSTTSAGATGGTTELWRYDTFTDGWQKLANLNASNQGLDLEIDSVRNVLYIIRGNPGSELQCFNLSPVNAVTIANVSVAPWALGTLPALPSVPGQGASLTMPDDLASNGIAIDSGNAAAAGSTATVLISSGTPASFGPGMVGLMVRFTSGTLAGTRRVITGVTNPTTLTVAAFGSAPAVGDTFVVEVPEGTATGGSTTTLVDSTGAFTANAYANADVVILSGTGAGQRRRIASNTATTFTLAAAVTGNARTGPFTTAPDATSKYRIVPSSDFLYYQNGTTGLYRLDLAQTTGAAWSASLAAPPASFGGGANTLYPGSYSPFSILAIRGSATKDLYSYNIGLNTWSTLVSTWGPTETINTGASVTTMTGLRRLFIQMAGSVRCYVHDLTTGMLEPAPILPYANPSTYDGKRARFVRTASGASFIYVMRAGGQEFFRVPVEWL